MNQSAVLITAYNRPEMLDTLLISLQNYSGRIYVSLDFPKNYGKQGEAYESNKIVCNRHSNIITEFQTFESNQGCFLGVTKAITWAFEREDKLIILEDDIQISESFMRFANLSLTNFQENKSVGSISGLNLVPSIFQSKKGATTKLSIYTASWGWATWKDRWLDYLLDLQTFPKLDWEWPSEHWSRSEKIFWKRIFNSVALGKVDSWAYRWMYSNWKRQRWTLTPNENLTLNRGFGSDATHTKEQIPPWWLPSSVSSSFEMKERSGSVHLDIKADEWISKNHFRTNFIFQIRSEAGRKFPNLSNQIKKLLPPQ